MFLTPHQDRRDHTERADNPFQPGIDPSLLASVPSPNPYILKTNLSASDLTIDSPYGKLEGNSSYVFKASEVAAEEVPGGGGTVKTVDSRNFPVAKTIASSIVTLKPGALRELHWHPNVSFMVIAGIGLINC
jgi:oxalate decarboxylase